MIAGSPTFRCSRTPGAVAGSGRRRAEGLPERAARELTAARRREVAPSSKPIARPVCRRAWTGHFEQGLPYGNLGGRFAADRILGGRRCSDQWHSRRRRRTRAALALVLLDARRACAITNFRPSARSDAIDDVIETAIASGPRTWRSRRGRVAPEIARGARDKNPRWRSRLIRRATTAGMPPTRAYRWKPSTRPRMGPRGDRLSGCHATRAAKSWVFAACAQVLVEPIGSRWEGSRCARPSAGTCARPARIRGPSPAITGSCGSSRANHDASGSGSCGWISSRNNSGARRCRGRS